MSENISKNTSEPKDVVEGNLSRTRTQSECSLTSDDGGSNSEPNTSGKRQRTTSQTFLVSSGFAAASPPKYVSLEEIMQAANGLKDMALVHQIVVDKDFRLERYEPEENSIQKVVKETMHRAFWDILKSDLAEDPPSYKCALQLLHDVKKGLLNLLLPQHTKLRQQINEVLDEDLIEQQVEKGILNYLYYAQYVISVMSKICAPVRDEKIKELTNKTDIVDVFKGILEMLDLMALDMANFTIQIAKPDIIAQSVEWERKKFADLLAIQPDGLQHTRAWLLKYLNKSVEKLSSVNVVDRTTLIRNLTRETVVKAATDLIEWDDDIPFPETFMLDEGRIKDLQIRTERVVILGTVLLITLSSIGSDLGTLASFKQTLKDHCAIIMESFTKKSDLKDLLPSLAAQVIKDIKETQKQYSFTEITQTQERSLTELINHVVNDDNKVRAIAKQRIKEFFQQIIESSTAAPQKVPSGFTSLQNELIGIAGQFLRIVSHNTTVFSNYYYDIIDYAIPTSA